MNRLHELARRVGMLVHRRQFDADLEEEMRLHLELRQQEQLQAGLSPDEAHAAAVRRFGNSTYLKEESRIAWGWRWLDDLLQDGGYSLRLLRKSAGFVAIAVVALALGIGFSSIVFSIFYNGILYPFPYRDAQQLAVIGIVDTQHGSQRSRDMYRLNEIAAFRKETRAFDDIVAYGEWDTTYQQGKVSESVHGCMMTPNSIQFWGVPPLLGRGISEQDARPATAPVVLLSYAFWKGSLNGDKSVLGKTITLNNHPHTIIGVMPRRFLLFGADVYVPVSWNRPEPSSYFDAEADNEPMFFFATARVKHSITLQAASADLQVIGKRLAKVYPRDYPERFEMTARPLNEVIVDNFKQTMLLLIAAVFLLLLISSTNVASLLLTHHTSRSREIGLRTALGATRGRLVRQLLVESLLLGTAGCLAGCLLAYVGLRMITLVPGIGVPGEADMSLNFPVLLFAVGISLVTAFLFGLSPALIAIKRNLHSNLQGSGVNLNASRGGVRLRAGLVVGQVGLSVLLLVFAGLMIRSFLAVTSFNPGIKTEGLLVGEIHFPAHLYDAVAAKRAFFDQALARVSTLPGVTNAAVSFGFPLMGIPKSNDVTIPGKPHSKPWLTGVDAVSEGYFRTLELQLLRGRLLSAADVTAARNVAVINSTLARNYFPGEDPLGQQIKFNVFDELPGAPRNAYFQIVGVVTDVKNFRPDEPILPQAYIPYTFASLGDRCLIVRSVTNPLLLTNPLREVLAGIDSNVVLVQHQTVAAALQQFVYAQPEFRLISFGTCAALGLCLALIGLFGVMSYSVTLETHELGVRMALGAQPGDVLSLVLRKGLTLVGSGIGIGLLVSFLSVRILRSQLWGVSAFDPWTLVVAPVAFISVALLACYFPARRATRVDPIVALRYD